MRRIPLRAIVILSALFTLVIAIAACSSATESSTGELQAADSKSTDLKVKDLAQRTNDCPEALTLRARTGWELAGANYSAQQEGETVTVTATGDNPTAGFKVQFARDPVKIFPPRLVLYRRPPDGPAAQVITPFTVCVAFKSRQPVSTITVRDNKGEHRIKVEPVRAPR